MSIVEHIKKMWYRDHDIDVYEPHDFDDLFKTEEQEPLTPSRILSRSLNKDKNTVYPQKKGLRENLNVIEHPTLTPQSEVIVMEPRSFDEAVEIIEELRCRRSVVLNLQYLDSDQSQRIVDFLSGATHAIDGHQQRIGQGVFIFVPSNFTLNTESQEARALKDAFFGRNREKEKEQTQYQQYQFSEPAKKSSIF